MPICESTYPRFLRHLLDSCPQAGTGVHPWLFRVARYLHRYHSPGEIADILNERATNCGRHIEPHEIVDAVNNSIDCAWRPSGKTASERRAEWNANPTVRQVPEFNALLAEQFASRVSLDITPEWLKTRSPSSVHCLAGEFMETIFEPGEKAIIFTRYKSQGTIWPDNIDLNPFMFTNWPDGAWFLCNPVDGKEHWNPRMLKHSQRSAESVTSFRYAVLECDQEPKEKWFGIWLKILVQLPLEIVSITASGNRGAHALVRVWAPSKAAWDHFKAKHLRPLVPYGADDGALSAVRLTRLPNCFRGDQLQELLFLNPDADGTPIFQSSV